MKTSVKSKEVYERRQSIAIIYIISSFILGFIMVIIGSGLDIKGMNSVILYLIGMILLITGLSLLSIIMIVTSKTNNRR